MANAVSRGKQRDAYRSLMLMATATQGDEKSIKKAARALNPETQKFDVPDEFIEPKSNEEILRLIGEK